MPQVAYSLIGFILFAALGFLAGGASVFFALEKKRRSVADQKRELDAKAVSLVTARTTFESQAAQWTAQENARLAADRAQFEHQSAAWIAEQEARWKTASADLQTESARMTAARVVVEGKLVSYNELQDENSILKRDLRNLDVSVRKLQLDHEVNRQAREALNDKISELGSRYLKENVKWIGASLNANNYVNCKQRLQDVIGRVRGIGFEVSVADEEALLANLRSEYEKVVRQALEREEQARIKAQIREEQKREKEIERELNRLETERAAIKAALERALLDAHNQHSEEVERLRARLAEAEERTQRTISQAQLTKAGFVYVLSNIGSFGMDVFKVGMSRRLDPLDRVKELGDASVPFPFDVHMMISANDAPSLENALHRKLHTFRVNKTNPRKEYFKIDIATILQIVKENHGEVEYVADAEALQFRQTLAMSEQDQEFIEHVYEELEAEGLGGDDDT